MSPVFLTPVGLCLVLLLCSNYIQAGHGFQNPPRKKIPKITWLPSPMQEGMPLGPAQLNAKADVPGTFKYDPSLGTVLPAGPIQTLSANFTPSDQSRYEPVNNIRVQIPIIPGLEDPKITWENPPDITYGAKLGATQLNAKSNVPGTFTYSPGIGTVLLAGDGQILSTTFTPDNTIWYRSVNKSVTINIKPATLTVKAKSAEKVYGSANPAFTIDYSGFVSGDTPGDLDTAPTAASDATESSNTGTFPIIPSGGVDNNYTFLYSNGILTITKAVITAHASDQIRKYGSANPAFTIDYSGFVNGDTPGDLDKAPAATSAATVNSNAGTFPVIPAGGVDANYTFLYSNGVLTITKAVITARADDKIRRYGLANPVLTITYTGFVNTETVAVIDLPPKTATTATLKSPAGDYPILIASGQDHNYSFVYVPGVLTITTATTIILSNFQIVTNEDWEFAFSYRLFHQNFSADPGDSIVNIKIVKPPVKGSLWWSDKKIVAGDEVAVVHGELIDFHYSPPKDFSGGDTVVWNVSGGTLDAAKDALIIIYVIPINDAPVLTDNLPDLLPYSAGNPPVIVAEGVVLEDVDNSLMAEAKISIITNHSVGDSLAVAGLLSSNLTATFDTAEGVLTLSGMDSKSNYAAALGRVVFSSPISGESFAYRKTLSLTVNDGTSESNPLYRTIQFENTPELNIVNAFTPNQDGVNDYWDLVNLEYYSQVKVIVFDQNGQHVFDCGSQACAWDGTIKGSALPPGPYFYNIELDGGKKKYRGTVTILK